MLCLRGHRLCNFSSLQGEPLDLFAAEEAPEEYQRVFVEGVFDHAASQVSRVVGMLSSQSFSDPCWRGYTWCPLKRAR